MHGVPVLESSAFMANPFDDDQAQFMVLKNSEGQHSLWPSFAAVPAGWECIFGVESRQACLDFVERNWTDIRPESVRTLYR